MSVSFWQQSVAADPIEYDYVVIGGGIVGVSSAYWFKKLNPGKSVAIIEARSLAWGASGRNAGFVIQGTATDFLTDVEKYGSHTAGQLYRLTAENRDLIERELDADKIRFSGTGSIIAAGSTEENERLRRSVGPVRSAGGRVVHLTQSDVNRRLNSSNFFGGLLVSTGATVNPVRLVKEIAERSEAVIYNNSLVEAVTGDGDSVEIRAATQTFRTPIVTVALNAYLPTLFPSLRAMVTPIRAQMLATTPADGPAIRYPVYSHHGYYYLRQAPDGRLLVGGARHLHRQEEVGYEDTTTVSLQNALSGYIETYFPGHRYQEIEQRWSGTMGFSPDGIPSIGNLPGMSGRNYWAAGFTGHGMSLGFLIGRTLANLASGNTPHEAELFNPERLNTIRQNA